MSLLDTTFLNNATREQIDPAVVSQAYAEIVGFAKLRAKGRVGIAQSTGIRFNTVVKKHEAMGILPGYDPLATQQINPVVQGVLNPGLYYAVVGLSEREVTLNTGGDQVKELDMLKVQVDNGTASLRDRLGYDWYGSSTVDSVGYPTLIGLGTIVGGSTTSYAGIAGTSGVFVDANGVTVNPWSSYVDSVAHPLTKTQDPADAEYLPNIMYSAYFATAAYPRTVLPTDILLGIREYQLYMNIAGDKLRLTNVAADLTFGGATFAGGMVTMASDRHVPTGASGASYGRMWFLNFADFQLDVYPGKDFQMQSPGWFLSVSPAARMARWEFAGQIYCRSRLNQSAITDIQVA